MQNKILILCCLGLGISVSSLAASRAPSIQVLLAEVEDASAKIVAHESELMMLAERLDEQDSQLQKLSTVPSQQLSQKLRELEQEQKTLAKTVSVLTASVQTLQTTIQNKFQEVQASHKTLTQDLKLLRQSLLALVNDSSLEGVTDFTEAVPSHIHLVRSGETLNKIAAKHKISVAELKKLNNLSSDVIYENQKLYLPKKK